MKVCVKCSQVKPFSAFYQLPIGRYQGCCKACKNERTKELRQNNAVEESVKARKWREAKAIKQSCRITKDGWEDRGWV